MAITKIADIVATIPYGNEGKKRYRTVGALLQHDQNDPSKGPGFTISLETIFNPAGMPDRDGQVLLSCYNPREPDQARGAARGAGFKDTYRAPPPPPQPDFPDDDIPF